MSRAPSQVIKRVAIVVSHAIQHFCPYYSSIAKDGAIELKVFFASKSGLAPQWDPGFGREVQWTGLRLDFPHHFLNGELNIRSSATIDAPSLEVELDVFQPHVVVVYGYWQKLQRRAMRWCHSNQRKILMISDSETRRKQPLHIRAMKRVVLPWIYRGVDGFLTTGNSNEDHYQMYGVAPDKLFRSPFSIDVDSYDPVYAEKAAVAGDVRTELGLNSDDFIVGCVGKLVRDKRHDDLVDALSSMAETNSRLVLLLIGAGPKEAELRQRALKLSRHKVEFVGFVQPIKLPRLYATMNLYVHPSSYDHHPLAISEAIYMGCPVVVSDAIGSYGTTDDVQHGRNGFVFECRNIRQLASAIARVERDAELQRDFSEASRTFAVQSQRLAHGGGLRAALAALSWQSGLSETTPKF